MQLVRGLSHLALPVNSGCVATIGNFDGVHRGHQALLQQLRQQALALGLPTVVITFEPQPREFFDLAQAPARLTNLREKYVALAALGIDYLVCLNFNPRLAQLTAAQFIGQLLVQGLGVRYLVVGDDFRFGNDRSGDFQFLKKQGNSHGFTVENTHTFERHGERVSSTRIRECLEQDDFKSASVMLCKPFFMSGRVVHGQKLGRTIGVPTANVLPKRVRTPVSGVFAVEVRGLGEKGKAQQGVANLGTRPTVGGDQVRLEVHLLNFNQDIYGKYIQVMFRHKIRDEQKFDGLDALKAAIQNDIETAKTFFNA